MTHSFPSRGRAAVLPRSGPLLHAFTGVLLYLLLTAFAHAHGVAEGDKGYIQEISGTHLLPFTYLGAKHMVTGYDHLLFLAGVIFILYQLKGIGVLFADHVHGAVHDLFSDGLLAAVHDHIDETGDGVAAVLRVGQDGTLGG